jgi:hypothetical protein
MLHHNLKWEIFDRFFWNFVKGSGKKLFGGGDGPAPDGGALQDEIKELGLDLTGT